MTQEEAKQYYDDYHDMVFRIAFLYFKNEADAYDVVQEVFIKFIKEKKAWKDCEHVKAWLIQVTNNQCKSILRSFWRRNKVDDAYFHDIATWDEQASSLLYALVRLPNEASFLLYMHYYEGYRLNEIAHIMKRNASTIRSKMVKARALLKKELERQEL